MSTVDPERPRDLGRDIQGWQDLCALDDIADKRGKAFVVRGTDVAVMRDGDEVFALGGVCPHRGGPIAEGEVVGGTAVCPMHLWDFDLVTGISPYNPVDRLPAFCARVRDGRVEIDADSVPMGPGRPDVYLGPWIRRGATDRGMELIHGLAQGGSPEVASMGSRHLDPTVASASRYPSLDDVVILPAQLARQPLLDTEPVDTTVRLGTRAPRPLELSMPIEVSHMSFGAMSREAKISLATGAKAVGTAICSGEGGMHPEVRDAAGAYVLEMASGYFGWTEAAIGRADAVEIKIGQGAKPGLGGTLPGRKVTAEIAEVRGVPVGEAAHSPAHFEDLSTPQLMATRLEWIRSVNPQIPIGIKISAGHVLDDIAVAVDVGADYVVIDGHGGGTGAAPVHVRDEVGVPSWTVIHRVRNWLDSAGHRDVQIVVTGGFRTPADMAKGLALGADVVALATAAMMAIGCQQYRACHRGTCPVGITTQNPKLRARLDIGISARRLERFLDGANAMIVDYCRITGRSAVGDLCHDDLAALTGDTAQILDLPLMG